MIIDRELSSVASIRDRQPAMRRVAFRSALVLVLWLTGRMPPSLTGSGRSVRVTAYGDEDEVLLDQVVRPYGESMHFSPYESGRPVDAVLSGPASAVWAWCWGRTDAAHPVDVAGDADAVDELRRILATVEQ